MTTVILIVIGVIIAAFAAIMMMFWGGSSYYSAHDKADAARLVGDSVQIEAAIQAYRAEEGRMPGSGTGVDASAMQDLISKKYLTTPPPGLKPGSTMDWKIDWNYGIARSTVGDATDSKALAICTAARAQLGLKDAPKKCDDASIEPKDPCCIMNGTDAAA